MSKQGNQREFVRDLLIVCERHGQELEDLVDLCSRRQLQLEYLHETCFFSPEELDRAQELCAEGRHYEECLAEVARPKLGDAVVDRILDEAGTLRSRIPARLTQAFLDKAVRSPSLPVSQEAAGPGGAGKRLGETLCTSTFGQPRGLRAAAERMYANLTDKERELLDKRLFEKEKRACPKCGKTFPDGHVGIHTCNPQESALGWDMEDLCEQLSRASSDKAQEVLGEKTLYRLHSLLFRAGIRDLPAPQIEPHGAWFDICWHDVDRGRSLIVELLPGFVVSVVQIDGSKQLSREKPSNELLLQHFQWLRPQGEKGR